MAVFSLLQVRTSQFRYTSLHAASFLFIIQQLLFGTWVHGNPCGFKPGLQRATLLAHVCMQSTLSSPWLRYFSCCTRHRHRLTYPTSVVCITYKKCEGRVDAVLPKPLFRMRYCVQHPANLTKSSTFPSAPPHRSCPRDASRASSHRIVDSCPH